MKITKANEDYLEAILILENENKNSIKSIDISKLLNVSKPAVTKPVMN
jgi:Mn-dependent DtxR family transcriptional regulator